MLESKNNFTLPTSTMSIMSTASTMSTTSIMSIASTMSTTSIMSIASTTSIMSTASTMSITISTSVSISGRGKVTQANRGTGHDINLSIDLLFHHIQPVVIVTPIDNLNRDTRRPFKYKKVVALFFADKSTQQRVPLL
ncbi:MAG: hypothetical protein GY757_30145 [bacterium]|nr:hypothetical protein [bacterium]